MNHERKTENDGRSAETVGDARDTHEEEELAERVEADNDILGAVGDSFV